MSLFMIWFVIFIYEFTLTSLESYSETFDGKSYTPLTIICDLFGAAIWPFYFVAGCWELGKAFLRRHM